MKIRELVTRVPAGRRPREHHSGPGWASAGGTDQKVKPMRCPSHERTERRFGKLGENLKLNYDKYTKKTKQTHKQKTRVSKSRKKQLLWGLLMSSSARKELGVATQY